MKRYKIVLNGEEIKPASNFSFKSDYELPEPLKDQLWQIISECEGDPWKLAERVFKFAARHTVDIKTSKG